MRMSDVMTALAARRGERISVADIFATLSDRSIPLMIVTLGIPNCVPMPPPVPSVSAAILILIAAQILAGRTVPWVPRRVLSSSLETSVVRRAVDRARPWVDWLEGWSRPRLNLVGAPASAILTAMLLITFAVGLLLCPPVIGQMPFGLAIALIGLALVEHDGYLVFASLLAGLIGMAISLGFAYATIVAVLHFL